MTGGDVGLLDPGRARSGDITDDAAVVAAMLNVEVAWARALAASGAITVEQAEAIAAAAAGLQPDVPGLATQAERIGNAVLPVVSVLREAVRDESARAGVHRGLTSQDVLDSALMLITRNAVTHIDADLRAVAHRLAELADKHRDTVMAGRTLTQHAVPITFGLKAAGWLLGVLDAQEALRAIALPVQAGGAAGTLALAGTLTDSLSTLATTFAEELGLVLPITPWHTRRTPVTAAADALVGVTDVLGVIGANIALLSRPEFAELSEGGDRGGSSTMPQKHNPVLSVLLRSAALQAPMLAATVHVAAGQSVDERPDGAWHAEWAAYRRLVTLAVVAANQAAELLDGLVVHADVMESRAKAHTSDLLAERYGVGKIPADATAADYLGATPVFIDAALARANAQNGDYPPSTTHDGGIQPQSAGNPQSAQASAAEGPELAFTRLGGDQTAPALLVVGAGLGTAVTTLWRDAALLLEDHYEVVGVDLPGHGASPAATGRFTVAELAAAVRSQAETLAAGRPTYYAGVSLAGAVAFALAVNPGPFAAAAAIASASRLGDPDAWLERAELVRRAGTPVMVSGSVQRWFAPDFPERQPEAVGRMLHDLSDTDDASYALCCEALAAYDLTEARDNAVIPLLIAPGDLDQVVTVERADADAAATPGAHVVTITGVAHQPPVEDPAQLAHALRTFFDGTKEDA